jgi:hypothetical protein
MKELARRVKESWLVLGAKLVPGASAEDIQRFEARYGVALSTEVRDYFAIVGGMEEYDTDGLLLEFHPLHAIQSVPEALGDWGGTPDYREIVHTLSDAEHCFVFIQYLYHSHVYALHFTPEPTERSPVVWIYGAQSAVIAHSLTDFLEAYRADPESILFPEQLYPRDP